MVFFFFFFFLLCCGRAHARNQEQLRRLESICGKVDLFCCRQDEGNAAEISNIDLNSRGGFGTVEDDTLGEGGLIDFQVLARETVFAEERGFG